MGPSLKREKERERGNDFDAQTHLTHHMSILSSSPCQKSFLKNSTDISES
jgi:hypothetical protein